MTLQEEQVWVEKAQANPQHFEVLYKAFLEEIYRFVYYKTSAREVAEDLTSQIFMQALEHIKQFRYQSGARFSSWLYTIARNMIVDHYRKQRPVAALDDTEPLAVAVPATAGQNVDQQFQEQRVQTLLQQLPSADQEILRLRLWQEKEYGEISEIMQLNQIAVRARYSRALKKFSKLYRQYYDPVPGQTGHSDQTVVAV